MSVKQKTDLFRIVTLRAPQLVDENNKDIGFINHPAPENSHFLKGIIDVSDIIIARQKVVAASKTFSNIIESINYIKEKYPEVWEFSNILLKNKNQISDSKDYTPPSALNINAKIELWDNIFFSLVTSNNKQIRQACLQLIIASNYIDKLVISDQDVDSRIQFPRKTDDFTISEKRKQYYRRLANAKPIIPAAFSVEKNTNADVKAPDSVVLCAVRSNSAKQQ